VRRQLNISFADDDKFFRCPRRGSTCQNGYLGAHFKISHWKYRTTRCPECSVLVLPYVARWIRLSWLRFYVGRIPGRIGDWWWEFNYRRGRR
jgi:hypothetical protein